MSALADYYAAQTAEKYAGIPLQQAQARLTQAQASEVGANAESARNLQGAEGSNQLASAGLAGANAGLARANADQVPLNASTDRAVKLAAIGLNNADIANKNALTQGTLLNNAGILPTLDSNLATSAALRSQTLNDNENDGNYIQMHAKGVSKVTPSKGGKDNVAQGKGKPTSTDTVPAMLTPGEAVLNKGAVEHYGSDLIAHMNKMGLMRQAAQQEHATSLIKAGVLHAAAGIETVRPVSDEGLDYAALTGLHVGLDPTAYAKAYVGGASKGAPAKKMEQKK